MEKRHSEFEILQITDKASPYLSPICAWMMGWWGQQEGFSMEKMYAYIQHSLCEDRIPQTFLLLYQQIPVGMYQFSMADIDVRPDIYPWLINIYIDKAYRGQGLLNVLMASAREKALNLGLKRLYLFTKHTSLYERYGWVLVEEFETFLKARDIQRLYCLEL